ncbi:MAG: hypothetical protein ACOYYS_06180 [Chloroflexota bacterium]
MMANTETRAMIDKFSTFELVWRTRVGGGGKTHRNYLEFMIDGQCMSDYINTGDYIGCLGWLPIEFERLLLGGLLLECPSVLGSTRYPIYICPECGDMGCGAITVEIEKISEGYIWKSFGYENDYDRTMRDVESYKGVGPFQFRAAEYSNALKERAK